MQEVGQHQKISVKKSSIHGWGVFADEDIPGSVLIEVAPGIVTSQILLNSLHYVAAAEGLKAHEVILDQYGIQWSDGLVFFPLGWVGLYNHSDDPSTEFEYINDELIGIRSLREIKAGEEITVSYGAHWWKLKSYLQKS